MDDCELVKLIENYPILYDKAFARSFKNAARKDEAWKEISLKMKASERACITRWKSIRDRFGKELRRFQSYPNEPTYWEMFPSLLFLMDHYKQGLVKHENLDKMIYEPKEKRKAAAAKQSKEEGLGVEEEDFQDDIFSQQLIELVKMHPVLYDRHQIRVSKNLTAKNLAWRQISESLSVSEELCYNSWKKLRDRFAREYRNHQINPTQPLTWRHFDDLLFLGRHFRKGVPLVIENIKKRGRPPKVPESKSTADQISFNTDNEDLDEEEQIEFLSETEFLLNQTVTTTTADEEGFMLTEETPAESSEDASNGNSEQLLGAVIANMETVLQQSKELQLQLQMEQQQQKTNHSLLAKAQMLLDGLSSEQRRNAERKIIHFLCECQMKTLDGGEIEDVTATHIFNS